MFRSVVARKRTVLPRLRRRFSATESTDCASIGDVGVADANYREKIDALPTNKTEYKELLKQVKFLGDNMTKPSGTEYTKEQIDLALEVLPLALDDIYATDAKVVQAQRILAKVSSSNGAPKP
ncbi:MAG: hypothetical protein WC840_04740 [Candidatus Peribacteraceae bacterium]